MAEVARRVSIVGAGQAGSALAHGFTRAGLEVVAVTSRTTARARALAAAVGTEATDLGSAAARSELLCICTPDRAIVEVVAALVDAGAGAHPRWCLHTSGALGPEVLEPLAVLGVETGVLHPVTPLVPPDDPATLAGKPMGFDAAGDAGWVEMLVVLLGGHPVSLAGVDRVLYHAACVMAANLVVGLAGAAERVLDTAGVDAVSAGEIVTSLLASSAVNVGARGPAGALTGPVRRGDAGTVARHIDALTAIDPRIRDGYRSVSAILLDLVEPGPARDRTAAVLGAPVGGLP